MKPTTLALALAGVCVAPDTSASAQRQVAERCDQLELMFEANLGQTDAAVEYLARAPYYTVYLTSTELVLTLGSERGDGSLADDLTPPAHLASVLRVRLVEPASDVQIEGLDEMPGKVHYLMGNDPEQWRANVPTFRRVRYLDVQPGVDFEVSGRQGELEYDFILAPGANPESVLLDFEGVSGLEIDGGGGLVAPRNAALTNRP